MKRWLALAIVGLMLTVPLASAEAAWERANRDPGRSGALPYDGPQTNDTAFTVELPGTPLWNPTVTADGIYQATTDMGFEGLDDRALWRIDPATADTERVFNFTDSSYPIAVTTDLLVTGHYSTEEAGPAERLRGELVAREIPSGEERWRMNPFDGEPDPGRLAYYRALVDGDTVYVGFAVMGEQAFVPTPANTYGAGSNNIVTVGVTAVHVQTGEELWTWTRSTRDTAAEDQELVDPTGGPDRSIVISGLATDGERVYVYMRLADRASTGDRSQFELRALQGGESLWTRTDTEQNSLLQGYGRLTGGLPVTTDSRVHIRLDAFQALNPATGETIWESPAGRSDHIEIQGASAMAVTEDAFVGTSTQSVYRLDPVSGELEWQATDAREDKIYSVRPMGIDGDTIYAPTVHDSCGREGQGLEARDLATGDLRWSWNRTPSAGDDDCGVSLPATPSLGPGLAVVALKDGVVTVLGETEASLGEPDVETVRYPGEGEEVTIDASGAEPGAFGEATRYMVDWGDGTVSGWQATPTFTHAYNETSEHEAQVYAGNDANQTSSTVVTMRVGEEEPNLAQTAFQKENQDMTFGILGVALALGGGAIGATKRYRKRSRLEEELQTLETGFEETNDRPGECEAFLETRRARARSLVLDGVLTEEQGTIIQDRADELRRDLRTAALEDEFGFLPYSLVTKARQMLEDGRVTTLEVEAFESALDEVEGITDEQRTVVRERIEAWKARDEGGGER